MTQSALWPFHTWLISSLNSPTPVSALMHAGLINGGGFLLARFAPLFLQQPYLLHFIFIVGMITTVLGTTWKLMQSDVKRMFACSTMGQMGFMIVQCGLGLFPAAIAHLCFHGFFKAYLFLSSGSAIRQKRVRLERSPKVTHFLLALVCAMFGAYTFALISGKNIFAGDTTLFLIGITFIAGIQCALAILHDDLFVQMPLAIVTNIFFGALYAMSVKGIYLLIAPLNIQKPQPLNLLHTIGFTVLFLGWLIVVFGHNFTYSKRHSQLLLQWYVIMLNASQPHTDTITAHRNDYTF
jgi:NAD(P)H-quinone oxidoreductase subunit 5